VTATKANKNERHPTINSLLRSNKIITRKLTRFFIAYEANRTLIWVL